MNLLRLELKKTNIRPYFFSVSAIFACILGLMYIFAWVPHLDSGDENAAVLFSSYRGIMSISGAIALMAFSALSSAMGFIYVIREYSGANAILLFCYSVDRKSVLRAKIQLLLIFTSITMFIALFGSFLIFAVTGKLFCLVDNGLYLSDFAIAFRNTLVLIVLADGIALCSVRIGFIRKSNSITVISAILGSMLLANITAQINSCFPAVLGAAIVIFLIGIVLSFNLARKIDIMEI